MKSLRVFSSVWLQCATLVVVYRDIFGGRGGYRKGAVGEPPADVRLSLAGFLLPLWPLQFHKHLHLDFICLLLREGAGREVGSCPGERGGGQEALAMVGH